MVKAGLRNKILLAITLLFLSIGSKISFSQTLITIGTTSVNTSNYLPIHSCNWYNYSQQIYTTSELIAGGAINGGQINQIRFRNGSLAYPNAAFKNWTVFLANTNINNFSSGSGWMPSSSMTQVFSGDIPTLTSNGWVSINLTNPFTWTGSNLLVAIDENTSGSICTQSWYCFDSLSSTNPISLFYYSNTTNPLPSSPPPATSLSNTTRSQVQFNMLDCTGTPSAGFANATASTICPGVDFLLSATGLTIGPGIQYQWQVSTDGGISWSNIFGAHTSSITISQSVSSLYRIQTFCSSSGFSSISNIINVGIVSTPYGGIISTNQTICSGDTPSHINLSGQSGTGLQWQYSTNGVSGWTNMSGATSSVLPGNFIFNSIGPLLTPTYFRAEITNGCPINNIAYSGTHLINVNPNPLIAISPTQSICNGDSTNLSALSSIGLSTFSWYPTTGLSSPFIANPVAFPSNSTTYSLVVTSPAGCSSSSSTTIIVNPTPIITISGIQSICLGDSITVNLNVSVSPATFNWTPATGLSAINIANPTAFPTTSTTYTVQANANGCSDSLPITITVNPNPTASIITNGPLTICANESYTFSYGGIGAINWEWHLNGTIISNATSSSCISNLSGTYTVVATSPSGCTSISAPVVLTVNPLPYINAGINQDICLGDSVLLNAAPSSNIVWSNGYVNGQYVSPQTSTTYIATTTDSNNCTNSDTVLVTVLYPSDSTINVTSLGPYTLNGTTYSQSGIYTQTINNAVGCDSTITLNLIYYGTGIDESDTSPLLLVIPNPSSDGVFELVLQNAAALDVIYVRVYDKTGRVVFDASHSVDRIDLANHGSGMYVLEVGLPNVRALQKLAIVR
jgi:hypothetical protein